MLTSDTVPSIPRARRHAQSAGGTGRLSGLHRPQALATCKQWGRVAETLAADKDAHLVVTGYPVLDKETEAIVVLGQSVTMTLSTTSRQGKRPSGK
jgi:hypothetical protein